MALSGRKRVGRQWRLMAVKGLRSTENIKIFMVTVRSTELIKKDSHHWALSPSSIFQYIPVLRSYE